MKELAFDGHSVSRQDEPRSAAIRIDAEELFRAHAPFVATFLHRLGTPRADVDDLVQEVFLVVHRKGGYVAGAGQPRTWLAAITLRIARSGHRTRYRRREDQDPSALNAMVATGKSPEQAADIQNSLERVLHALRKLDLDHRAAFVLYEIEGETCEAIAEAFGVPIGTVYSRLHHARRRFLEAYAALDHQEFAGPQSRLAEGI